MPGQLPTQKIKAVLHFLYKAILGPLESCFNQLDQEFLKKTDPIFLIHVFLSQGKWCFVKKQCLRYMYKYNYKCIR